MRVCERGADSTDRAPAHRQHCGQTRSNRPGEPTTTLTEHLIKAHRKEAIQAQNAKIALTQWPGRGAIRSHCRKAIFLRNQGNEVSVGRTLSVKANKRRSEEAVLSPKCSRQVIRRHKGSSALWRNNGVGGAILLCILLLLSLRGSCGSASLGAQLVCARAPGLTEKQRALCRASPAAMAAIATGLKMAYSECRSQLSGRRWNCSGVGDGNHFSHVMPLATREAAFTYAITSAGVTHALSAACARGDLPACGCAHRRRMVPGEQWEWGGGSTGSGAGAGAGASGVGARCGEAAYGARFARRFLDARELERDARALMNLHNNRLGRKMVKELVRRECKCHGVSGSCAVRTCWRALPSFKAVGAALRDKYTRAKMVTGVERGATSDGQINIQLIIKRLRGGGVAGVPGRAARKSELVFLAPSPTYCEADPAAGALGTHQRHCNNTSRGEDGCETLCCGRGHSTVRRQERVQCRCQFQWCCRVRCDTCLARTEHHVCN